MHFGQWEDQLIPFYGVHISVMSLSRNEIHQTLKNSSLVDHIDTKHYFQFISSKSSWISQIQKVLNRFSNDRIYLRTPPRTLFTKSPSPSDPDFRFWCPFISIEKKSAAYLHYTVYEQWIKCKSHIQYTVADYLGKATGAVGRGSGGAKNRISLFWKISLRCKRC